MEQKSKNGVSIIGGTDGPTSVFIAGHSKKQPLRLRIKIAYIDIKEKSNWLPFYRPFFSFKKEIYFYKYLRYYSKQHFSLICRDTVSIDITASDTVTPSCHFIPTVAFYGIDGSTADTLYNSNVVNRSIISPVKEYNISYHRGITSVTEPAFTFKPLHTVRTKRKFQNDSTLNITALVCTPGHKTGTPLYPACKSIPAPVSCSTFSFLRCCHLNDCLITDSCRDSSKCIILKHMWYILLVPITAPPILCAIISENSAALARVYPPLAFAHSRYPFP